MVWHRNSIGVLIQRFFFTLILMTSIIVFQGCIDDPSTEFQTCIKKTSVPLIFVLIIVTFKVSLF